MTVIYYSFQIIKFSLSLFIISTFAFSEDTLDFQK